MKPSKRIQEILQTLPGREHTKVTDTSSAIVGSIIAYLDEQWEASKPKPHECNDKCRYHDGICTNL